MAIACSWALEDATWQKREDIPESYLTEFDMAAREEGYEPDLHFDFLLQEAEEGDGAWKYNQNAVYIVKRR